MDARQIVVLEGDETGQQLLEEALRVLAADVTGIELEFPRFDLSLPTRRATQNAVVQAKDVATVRSTFADAETITRLNGKPAIAIEVKKRIGANLIDTLGKVKLPDVPKWIQKDET